MSNENRVPRGTPSGGQFAASAKGEAGVSLGSDVPLSREELRDAWDTEAQMRRLGDGEWTTLADQSIAEVRGRVVVGPIVEAGEYVITDRDGNTSTATFENLPERAKVSERIATDAAMRARDLAVEADTDPWGSEPELSDYEKFEQRRAASEAEATARAIANGASAESMAEEEAALRAAHGREALIEDENVHPLFGEVIHRYTQEQAIADGVLVDHSKIAREAGFGWPVVMTAAAHADAVTWSSGGGFQDEEGRAWDVMTMAGHAARQHATRSGGQVRVGERIPFQMVRVPNTPRSRNPKPTTMHLVVSSRDDGSPCFTIMMPDED